MLTRSGGNCLALELHALAYANAGRKIPLRIHLIYLGNKEIDCILGLYAQYLFLFSTNVVYFMVLSFSPQTIHAFYKNHALKVKYTHKQVENLLKSNIKTLSESTFLANVPRFPKEQRLFEGSQASAVRSAGKKKI